MANSISQRSSRNVKHHTLDPFGLLLEAIGFQASIHQFIPSELRALVLRHRLVILRGFAVFDRNSLIKYCRTFGDLLSWDFGYVLDLVVHENPQNYLFTNGNVPFHWDGAFAAAEPSFLFFQCLKAPLADGGGQSLFCDTTRVWQQLSCQKQELWEQIKINYRTEKVAHYGGVTTKHLVCQHPHTNEVILRFAEPLNEESVALNPLHLDVLGLSFHQHLQFLSDLKTMLYLPENCYCHQWCDGDILIADNHALLHGRRPFSSNSPRHLQRVHIL